MTILDPVGFKVYHKQVISVDSAHFVTDHHTVTGTAIPQNLLEEADVAVTKRQVSFVIDQVLDTGRVLDVYLKQVEPNVVVFPVSEHVEVSRSGCHTLDVFNLLLSSDVYLNRVLIVRNINKQDICLFCDYELVLLSVEVESGVFAEGRRSLVFFTEELIVPHVSASHVVKALEVFVSQENQLSWVFKVKMELN